MIESKLAIFDDGGGRWGPMTDRRPVFELRTGAHTTRRRIERVLKPADVLFVPARLAAVMTERDANVHINPVLREGNWLLVNGRWPALDADVIARVAALSVGSALRQEDGGVVAAHLSAAAAQHWIEHDDAALPDGVTSHALDREVLYRRPWDVLDGLEAALRADLDASELPERDVAGGHAVRIAPDATVGAFVAFEHAGGPIVVDRGARIEPFVVLEGPCHVGEHAHIAAHAWLRAGTSIGPHCKVGGEVKHSVIQGHTNKAHLGYLGDSIVGEWSNLGADTNVSNLKNTYGHVRIALEPGDPAEDTGRTNHGPIIGDFVRTAIGTRLLTGSVVGTGAMLALSELAPKHVLRCAFCTDAGTVAHELDALLLAARRMMSRHGVELTDAEATLLRELHAQATARVA